MLQPYQPQKKHIIDPFYKKKTIDGEWQHIYVPFDGCIERIYINGHLVSKKDIRLLVKPSQFVTLGRNAEHEWPFTGYIRSLRFHDEYIPYKK